MQTFGKVVASLAFFLLLMWLGYAAMSGESAADYARMQDTAKTLSAQNEALRLENHRIEAQIVALREDARVIERQARNELELIRRDEVLVILGQQD
ncbi:MAG: septum formation initiator family protein [Myxococcota bacterium]|nr:septum formation initiator family protein [Myxococcota bacterium]